MLYTGEIYKSVNVYNSQNDDELSYPANEEIEVIEKSQYGWWKIRYHYYLFQTYSLNIFYIFYFRAKRG